jgi:MoxR-like ATPase
MLRLLNERVFDAGDGALAPVPLRICVAASNEWPQQLDGGKELGALFDRFLLRKTVQPILSAASRRRLLWHRDHRPVLSTSLSATELDLARSDVVAIPWLAEAREAMEAILRELAKEGIQPGDRRQHKAVAAIQAFAYLSGRDQVEPEHLEMLRHIVWEDPEEQPEKAAQIIARIANPAGMRINQLLLEAEQILSGADVRQLSEAAVASTKLQEIDKQLAALREDGRSERARRYVREQIRKIRQASIDAI